MAAGGLSQGERKLLDVAVAYALRPKLLFLDEPTSGVSTREKAPIMDIITSVVRSGGITAVIIEHDMDVVFTLLPAASWRCTRGRSSPTARRTRSATTSR